MSTTGVGPAGSVDRAEDTVGVVLYVLFEIVLAIYLEQLVILYMYCCISFTHDLHFTPCKRDICIYIYSPPSAYIT